MATKPSVALAAIGQKITATLWNNGVYRVWNFLDVTKPVCRTVQTVASSFVTGTWTAVPMDTETVDTDNQHSTVTNTSRVVIGGTLGWYRVSGTVHFASSVSGKRAASGIGFNGGGTPVDGSPSIYYSSGASTMGVTSGTVLIQATASTDYVELYGWQETGGTINSFVSSPYKSTLLVEYVGTLQ